MSCLAVLTQIVGFSDEREPLHKLPLPCQTSEFFTVVILLDHY